MRVLVVFFISIVLLSCKKEDCYDCTQKIKYTCNKNIEGYPKEFTSKLVACGDNIELVDIPQPIILSDTIGDTIYTYWRDTDCTKRKSF
jgi:hypothetical protein